MQSWNISDEVHASENRTYTGENRTYTGAGDGHWTRVWLIRVWCEFLLEPNRLPVTYIMIFLQAGHHLFWCKPSSRRLFEFPSFWVTLTHFSFNLARLELGGYFCLLAIWVCLLCKVGCLQDKREKKKLTMAWQRTGFGRIIL